MILSKVASVARSARKNAYRFLGALFRIAILSMMIASVLSQYTIHAPVPQEMQHVFLLKMTKTHAAFLVFILEAVYHEMQLLVVLQA